MAFDGTMISAIVHELSESVLDGRIDKIFQPERDEIILAVRCKGTAHRVLISSNGNFPRIHLTKNQKENPLTAPMFCMLLRKHIQGGKIIGISQHNFDRIVHIDIECYNEMGDLTTKTLVVEIMGKYSNVILVDDGVVLDSIKHVSYSQSSVRQILPGRDYVAAPGQNKHNPKEYSKEQFLHLFEESSASSLSMRKIIFQNYTGISPFSAGLICQLSSINPDMPVSGASKDDIEALYKGFSQAADAIIGNKFLPYIVYDGSHLPKEFSVIGHELYNNDFIVRFDSVSAMIESYYSTKDSASRIQQKSHDLRRLLQNLIERCVKKLDIQSKTLAEISGRDELKNFGELITSNIYAIPQGAASFATINFYDENMPEITIPLDPNKTATENAQSYFSKYNKQKRTFVALQEQMLQNEEELKYLESVREAVNHCRDEADLSQIREELANLGLIKKQQKTKKGREPKKAKPLHYLSSDGYEIFVGKNNTQNDELTMGFAAQDDIWLHTKNFPGSHVILKAKNGGVSNIALEEAAHLAAYYSKGRSSSLVPVDYCPRKQIKKPGGAKPGFVIYEGHKTAYITPDEAKINLMEQSRM